MDLPNAFFTAQSAMTLSGAVAMTYVVSNTCQAAFGFNPRWLALVIAVVIALFGVWTAKGAALDYIFGVVNGCLIYLSAAGISAISAKSSGQTRGFGSTSPAPGSRGFFAPWW